ncbi:hypothetical protein CDD83_10960 [Cordyceps sp. RAO-2017]|nr:hypothetical protein CDD83_10960 [Cordyceps sp. RAO-2017]
MGCRWTTACADASNALDSAPAWALRPKALLLFLTQRIRRGGSRLFLLATTILLASLALLRLTPSRLGYSLVSTSINTHDALRIVVFGSQDLLGSASGLDGNESSTWTQQLCKELKCSRHLSFVPKADSAPSLTSNSLYAGELRTLEQHMKTSDLIESPASDYDFALKHYPVPVQTADLDDQIQQFMSLPPDAIAPSSTLWIFTFGTWDIWNLASLPRQSAEDAVDALVSHLFAQIELVYRKSLNPRSVAYSDFWSGATPADIKRLTEQRGREEMDERELESFRVVIPELLDTTITPGWQTRPKPPAPHSNAEQARNAVVLTKRWNARIEAELDAWKAKGNAKPETVDEESLERIVRLPGSQPVLEYIAADPNPQEGGGGGGEGESAAEKGGVIYAPYPRRTGLRPNAAETILDVMMEGEMKQSGLQDGQGRGSRPENDSVGFLDVWTPCMAGGVARGEGGPGGAEACQNPDDHLFRDAFTVGQRAARVVARMAAERIAKELMILH